MSTAAAWDTIPLQPASGRPRLVVIEGGVGSYAPSPTALGAIGRLVLAVPRWMRLAVTVSVAALLMAMLFGIGGAGAASGPLGSVEVRPGQTLSEIARAEMPGVATAEAVARIQLANNLPSSQVRAGQILVIPAY